MQLEIRNRGTTLATEDAATIERRVRFALARFGHRIRRAQLLLADANGPRGGRDQHCTVRVLLAGLPPVIVEVQDVDPLAAVSRALERVARHVRDRLNRRRDLGRWDRGEE